MIRNTVKTRQSWWPFRGCVAGKRMVFVASVLNRVFILCESVLNRVYNFVWVSQWVCPNYSQISPWGQLAITDTPIKRTAAKSPAKTNYRRLTEVDSHYYGLSLRRTLSRAPSVRYKGSWLYPYRVLSRAIWLVVLYVLSSHGTISMFSISIANSC